MTEALVRDLLVTDTPMSSKLEELKWVARCEKYNG
jgi:hypothetical protein